MVYIDVSTNKVIVHMIPHTHCDPGWLITFEAYYETKVKAILTSLLVIIPHLTMYFY